MLVPDCRNDDYYNYDFLSGPDATVVDGYDCCVREAVLSAFENMEAFPPEDLKVKPSEVVAVLHAFREWLFSWIESERDDLITAMIDAMDKEEYEKNRAAAIERNGKAKYYDTRYYACTGKKVFSDDKPAEAAERESV